MSVNGGKADEIDEKADILCVAGTARQIGGLLNRLHSRFYAALSLSNVKWCKTPQLIQSFSWCLRTRFRPLGECQWANW